MQTVTQASLESLGFAIHTASASHAMLDELESALAEAADEHASMRRDVSYARRNLLSIPAILRVAQSRELCGLVEPILGPAALPVRGILFDKIPQANWHVGWHQDCAIAVKEKIDTDEIRAAGFGPWSVKAGVVHVEPPTHVLENMLTLRVHLDECGPDNGPLRVIAGSHLHGKLSVEEMRRWVAEHEQVTCCLPRGGVLAMRPLLLHASSRTQAVDGTIAPATQHRRVVHIEYAGGSLPRGLRWATE